MANQRQFDTPSAMLRRLREGCGSGTGTDYKPYTEVRDFYSRGRRLRSRSAKFKRAIHSFSNLEAGGGYLAEYLKEVQDIMEQFPLLPLAETEAIAKTLGIKRHPTSPRTGFHVVMTTDQVWRLKSEDGTTHEVAINYKYIKDRARPRNQEKRMIEEVYHARRGRQLIDFDELSVPKVFVINWGFIRGFLDPVSPDAARDDLANHIDHEHGEWVRETVPLQRELIARVVGANGASPPDVISAFYSLLAHRVWDLDIFSARLGPNFPCKFVDK